MRYYLQWAIAYAFAIASAVAASLFGFLSAAGPTAYIKALVLCLVAFAGCHGPAWAARLRHAYGMGAAFLGGLAAFACLIVTLWGGLGTMASGGEELRAERVKAATDAQLDREALARAVDQRRQIPAARPPAAVRPLIVNARDGTTYKAKLEAELANGEAAERLDHEVHRINERLRKAPPPVSADPEASAFAQLTGLSVETSAALKALLVSLALEAAAMVAMLVAWAERRSPRAAREEIRLPVKETKALPEIMELEEIRQVQPMRRAAIASSRPAPAPRPRGQVIPIPQVFGSVKKFAATCTVPLDGERLKLEAALLRYQNWCKEHALTPASFDRFCDEAERLWDIQADGGTVYAMNLVLTG
jgi:hypothetical protein